MTTPIASVIIPTHNRDTDLAKAVNSALAQSIQDIEVIVVDDASTDQTQDVLDLFGEIDDRLRVITLSESLGISGGLQRNHGAQEARGKYICYLDDDDLYTYRSVESRVHFMGEHPHLDFCWGASLFLRNHGSEEWKHLCRKRLVAYPHFGDQVPWQYGTIVPDELMHRAGVVGEETGIWWTPLRGEDQRLVQAFLRQGLQGAPVDAVVAIYGRHHAFDRGVHHKALRARAEAKEVEEWKRISKSDPLPADARMPEGRHGKTIKKSVRRTKKRPLRSMRTQAPSRPVEVPPMQVEDGPPKGGPSKREGV